MYRCAIAKNGFYCHRRYKCHEGIILAAFCLDFRIDKVARIYARFYLCARFYPLCVIHAPPQMGNIAPVQILSVKALLNHRLNLHNVGRAYQLDIFLLIAEANLPQAFRNQRIAVMVERKHFDIVPPHTVPDVIRQ